MYVSLSSDSYDSNRNENSSDCEQPDDGLTRDPSGHKSRFNINLGNSIPSSVQLSLLERGSVINPHTYKGGK